MNTTIDPKIAGSLSPEVVEFLNENKILIPVINCLGPKLAKKARLEHLKYLIDHKDMIPVIIKSGGIAAWLILKATSDMGKPYTGPIL